MAEINLIKIEGKPLEKLIDVISKGIGTLYKPRAIRNEADAESYKIEVIERAKSKALAEGKEIEANSLERMQERIIYQEQRKQNNIENVAQIAAEQIIQEQIISDEPVNEDWSTRFFNIVEDISDEEMQKLWGRILANEVAKPKSYSLRTLELVKNLTKDEADVFIKFANLRITDGNDHFIINPDNGEFIKNQFNITFSDRLLLTELGLIVSENDLQFSFNDTKSVKMNHFLHYGDKTIHFQREEGTDKQDMPVLVFTRSGIEISKLITQDVNIKYIEKLCSIFKKPTVKIEYGDLVYFNGQPTVLNRTEYN